MYRLLIVEDEKWEREGLRDFLDWSGLGIEVAGCACNGAEGLEMAELYRPDIILTDIMMPKMDGIAMSRSIRAFLPDARIIILTGYDDFQYAQQSFAFQAFDYILKPVEKTPMQEVVFRVLKSLEQEKAVNSEADAVKRQWIDYMSLNKEHLLIDMLERKTGFEYFPELIKDSGTHNKKVIAVLALKSVSHCFENEVKNAVGMMLNARGIAFSFSKPFKEIVICMNAPSAQSELETELMQLKEELKKHGIEAIFGIGEPVDDVTLTPQSYAQAKEAIGFRFLAVYGELLFYRDVKEAKRSDKDEAGPLIMKTYGITNKILGSVQKNDMDDCPMLVDDFLSALRDNRPLSRVFLGKFLTDAVNKLNTVDVDNHSAKTNETALDNKGFALDITAMDSLSQTKVHMMGFLKRIAEYKAGKGSSNEEAVAKKVIGIIEKRYADDIDLKSISEEIHLTPYYIGSIFRKHTGKMFSQYLNDYRIDKAKEMLHTGKIKVSRLADSVGIRNPSYFCSLFKSRFGISPGDYNDIVKGGRENV